MIEYRDIKRGKLLKKNMQGITVINPEIDRNMNDDVILSSEGLPNIQTLFGSHSVNNYRNPNDVIVESDGIPVIQSLFGTHSLPTDLNESLHHDLVDHYSHYTDDDKKAIKGFTQESAHINHHLHNQFLSNTTKEQEEHYSPVVKSLDNMIARHTTPKKLHVYSGIRQSLEGIHNHYGDNKTHSTVVMHSTFLSSSLSKEVASRFSGHVLDSVHNGKSTSGKTILHNHMMKITVPTGSHGAYVDHLSHHQGEKEMILPRNAKYRVKHHPTKEVIAGKHHVIWHAELLKDKE